MRNLVLIVILLFTGLVHGQELDLNGKVYGSVTSAMYKEAKLRTGVTPKEFHELTLSYPDLKIFFANRSDYQECMMNYGNFVHWELTVEEQRNLRNFIKRNGGRMPKYIPQKGERLSTNESTSNKVVQKVEDQPVRKIEEPSETSVSIDQSEVVDLEYRKEQVNFEVGSKNSNTDDSNENQPLNQVANKVVMVTPPMYLEDGTLMMNGSRISLNRAKMLSKEISPLAFVEFRRAARLRNWNYLWAYYSVFLIGVGVDLEEPAQVLGGLGVAGFIAFRENERIKAKKLGVEQYNKSLPDR